VPGCWSEIRRAAGNPSGKTPLELPKPKRVESRARPKELLERAWSAAQKRSRRGDSFFAARRRLLERLDIDGPINQLSAWSKLRADIEVVVEQLRAGSEGA